MAISVPVCTPGHIVHHLPTTLQLEATSALPPEVRPHILPFRNPGSGTSSSTTGSSSSARKKTSIDKIKIVIPNKLAVKKLIEKIELESEEKYKKEEYKKKENTKVLMKKTEMKKKEDVIDLEVKTRMTYLQGLGPETRQGPSPTSSYLGSGDLARASRSSAGPSLGAEDTRGHKVLE